MATFTTDLDFNSSHKQGDAKISLDKALAKFGETNESCDKCDYIWSGSFTANDGATVRASLWDWNGSLTHAGYVSIWVSDKKYLDEFKRFIQA
jgi:hypothetical protein